MNYDTGLPNMATTAWWPAEAFPARVLVRRPPTFEADPSLDSLARGSLAAGPSQKALAKLSLGRRGQCLGW